MSTVNNTQSNFSADPGSGWVRGARRVPSENFDARPDVSAIDTIVIHNISLPPGVFTGDAVEALFTNRLDFDAHPYYQQIRGLRVSAHFLVRRTGEVVQFVSTRDRAWHAGESFFYGVPRVNDFSVGVEIEGADDCAFDSRQYPAAAALIASLMRVYPQISVERLCGHSDIAAGRKTDPGAFFDWPLFRGHICQNLAKALSLNA